MTPDFFRARLGEMYRASTRNHRWDGWGITAEQPSPVVRALGLAYYWQSLLDEGKFASLTEIARAEGIDRAYVTRVFKLTRVSPVILKRALSGKVTMEALTAMGDCWVSQKA